MTQPVPVRATEAVRVTHPDGTVVERACVVEYATQAAPAPPALPPGPPTRLNTRPDGSGMWLDGCIESGPPRAHAPTRPPAPARPWWRWWR